MYDKETDRRIHLIDKVLLNVENRINIIVIGAGGTGSRMINNLARINIALRGLGQTEIHIAAYDNDIVEENNVGRQLFFSDDIGRNKADVVIERVNYAYDFDWLAIPDKFDMEDRNYNNHIFVTCVDNMETRKGINDIVTGHNYGAGLYWLDIGNGKDYGQIALSYHGKNEKNLLTLNQITKGKYYSIDDSGDDTPSCSLAVSLNKQSLFINSILAEYAANMLFQLLTEYVIDYNGVFINLSTLENTRIPIKK